MIEQKYPLRLQGGKLADMFAMQDEMLARLLSDYEDFKAQLFVDTATWGLRYWEESLGIPTDPALPLDARRERVKSRLRGVGTTTVAAVKRISESFTGYPVDVIELYDRYEFLIDLGHADRPLALASLSKTIREIKPAHLSFGFLLRESIKNFMAFRLSNLRIHARFRRGGDDGIKLNGTHKLDGTWRLNQQSNTRSFILKDLAIRARVRAQSKLTVTLEQERGWKLDGSVRLDGSHKLNSGYIKEEV